MNGRELMAEAKFFESYARWREADSRYEMWEEAVQRVMDMHRQFYADRMSPELSASIDYAEQAYKEKLVLGSQRALQFGGAELLKHHAKMYNCVSSYADRPRFFGEIMYLLLCGDGAGFSVQWHHVAKLPELAPPSNEALVFCPDDSIEGWADCFDVLVNSYFVGNEYSGKRVVFDLSGIRPKGSRISGGFKAPGPEPLRRSIQKVEEVLSRARKEGTKLRPIHVYDIVMHMADAVIAGGVRRSATICLFSPSDKEMMAAKTGNWFEENPQRGRSNNSAVLLRAQTTKEQFRELMQSVKEFGEPGFIFTDSTEFTYNPCVEIGKYPVTEDGRSGWQGCNLCEINGAACHTADDFMRAAKAAAILGTLQAGYTDFKYLGPESKEIFEREALIGVSITGWMNSPEVLFSSDNMAAAAGLVTYVNSVVAALLGIKPAARTTCVKPSGNASVLLGCASGIHGEHAPRYLRHVQLNKDTEVAAVLKRVNPDMIEDSVWSANGTDYVAAFPVVAPEGSIFKRDLLGVKQLQYVKQAQEVWVEYGTNVQHCTDPRVRHNVSNTIVVDDWDAVTEYVYENRSAFAGISFLPMSGDKDYAQAPFTEVRTPEALLKDYGPAVLFASALTAEAVQAFGDLWKACDSVLFGQEFKTDHADHAKGVWQYRLQRFAERFFSGNLRRATYCLKDVHNLYKWEKVTRSMQPVDWVQALQERREIDVDTIGAQACAGGTCDIAV